MTITFTCYLANAQECKYKVNKKDKFTGEVVKEMEPVLLLKTHKGGKTVKIMNLSMILKTNGGDNIFTLKFSNKGKGLPAFGPSLGNKLVLLLENGQKINLPLRGMASDYIKMDVFTHFTIGNENLKDLCKSKITDVRVISFVNPFDFHVSEEVNTVSYFKYLTSPASANL
ncbi:hypothetical protein L3073_00045 [Ancylomarina sp. DW003]|nr:hypothetical protein [Ancylomarina sp. DW003]MDE5420592.1 hypothetical protein [Ancylomarina sp. DW003]